MWALAILAAAAAPGDGKTMALDDWHPLAVYEVGATAGGPLYLRVHAGDLDGDGRADDAVLKLVCADGRLVHAAIARESGIGSVSERRQHSPVKIVKEWGPTTPMLREMRPTYDVRPIKTARVGADRWTEVTLGNADTLCGTAQAAATAIVKSKSNITNN